MSRMTGRSKGLNKDYLHDVNARKSQWFNQTAIRSRKKDAAPHQDRI